MHMCFHIYTQGAQKSKNLDIRDVFAPQRGNAYVYPHDTIEMARERDCFQLSSPWCLKARMCSKRVFFQVSSILKSFFLVSLKLTRAAVFARNSSNFEIKS